MVPRLSWTRYAVCIALISTLLPTPTRAQGWDDVGFWAADFTLNSLQYYATAELVNEYRQTYTVLRDGYRIVRGLVGDNHDLHKQFFDELSSVNPVVARYHKVIMIGQLYNREQQMLRRDAPRLVRLLRDTDGFTDREIEQVERVFLGMVERIGSSLNELRYIVVPGQGDVQMMDSERIVVVDRIYEESLKITNDIRDFRTMLLTLAAQRSNTSVDQLQVLYGVVP